MKSYEKECHETHLGWMPSLAASPLTDPHLALVQTSDYMGGWMARRSAKMVLVILEGSGYTS